MRPIKLHLLTLFFAATFSVTAQATVVTFEDVNIIFDQSPVYGTGDVADGYNGISGWGAVGKVWGYPAGEPNEAIGERWFYGSNGELSFDQAPVIFEGTYYKSYASDPNNHITSIELFYQGRLVHSILDPLAGSNLVWIASGYSGLVDKIYLHGGGEGFSIDNFTYSVAAVPEPSSYLLFLSGLTFVGLMSRKKNIPAQFSGSFSFGTGSVVTDAICSEIGKAGGLSSPACDALQKKAGKR